MEEIGQWIFIIGAWVTIFYLSWCLQYWISRILELEKDGKGEGG